MSYPPEPAAAPPPPPPVHPAPSSPDTGPPAWKRPWFVVIAVLVIGLLVASALDRDDGSADGRDSASNDGLGIDLGVDGGFGDESPTNDGSDGDDFVRCSFADDDALELEVVNNSSETANYFITIIFRDDDGTRLADELQTVNDLRPGERTIESTFSFGRVGTLCEAGEVDRFSAQTAADELDDANGCEVTGRDSFDDLTAATSVTNNSSETSDYFLTVAFLRADGVRVGLGTTSVSALAPGDTAPTDVLTFIEAEASTCDIVAVQRFVAD